MRRLVPLVATVGLACAPVALAADKTPVAVFYDGAFYRSGETVWQGDLFGPKPCAKGRRVFVFRVRPGRDQKIGSTRSRRATRTKNFYPWSFSEPGVARFGEYYARVKPTDTCRGARSAVMRGPG
jgi:hypothetical protein